MKIVFLPSEPITNFVPDYFGGRIYHAGLLLYKMPKYFSCEHHDEVHCISIGGAYAEDMRFERDGVAYHYLRSASRAVKALSFLKSDELRVRRLIREIDPDVVYAAGISRYVWYGHNSGYPTLAANTGSAREQYRVENVSLFSVDHWVTMLEVLCADRRVRHVQHMSPYVAQARLQKNAVLEKVIEPPIDEVFFEERPEQERKYFLYVGSITPRKNLLELVKAIEEIPQAQLRVISTTPSGPYYDSIVEYISEKDLSERVKFLGYKTSREIRDMLEQCIALAVPSFWESNGMMFAEAMAAGVPAVGYNVAAVPFTIKDGYSGVIVKSNTRGELRDALARLYDNPELARSLGVNGQKDARERWHPSVVTAAVREYMMEVCDRTRKRR
jgi:glycosyltransferase involved in cell wall biosynthesis